MGTVVERYYPSQANIWTNCQFSSKLRIELGIQKFNNRGSASDRGKEIHKGFEEILSGNSEWRSPNSEIQKAVEIAVNLFETQVAPNHKDSVRKLESRSSVHVHYRGRSAQVGGIADIVFHHTEDGKGDFAIYDLKCGFLPVSPVMNPQLMLYARGELMGLHNLAIKCAVNKGYSEDDVHINENIPITLGVIQTSTESVSTWTLTLKDLNDWFEKLTETLEGGIETKPKPGAHCRYCSVKEMCPEIRKNLKTLGDLINAS